MSRSTLSKEVDVLLKPAFKRLKADAMAAIRSTQEEMKGVLRVIHDAPEDVCRSDLPAPRLQLRWQEDGPYNPSICHYELVYPLLEHDVRNDSKSNHTVIQLGRTTVNGPARQWDTCDLTQQKPFRDGVHADIDSAVFGFLPVYVIAPHGRSARIDPNDNASDRGRALIRRREALPSAPPNPKES